MTKYVLISLFLSLAASLSFAQAAEKMLYIPKIETHLITSKYVDQTYEIHVWHPAQKKDGSERFPVLYMTDANAGVPLANLMHYIQGGGDAPRFMMVGIGYPVDHPMGGAVVRRRDLSPTPEIGSGGKNTMPLDGILEIESGKTSGGAPEFLKFIQEELIPFIDKKYNTIEGDRAFFGDSFGGLFGLYTLFHQPETFSRYIIGSPAIAYDNEAALKYAQDFMDSGKDLKARLFMSAGALEETPQHKMVTNIYRLHALLASRPMPEFHQKMYVIPHETHLTVPAINLIRGVQEVYDKPGCAYIMTGCIK
ncbi:alpha/beta hydrolase [Paremcibacter congregatus]|uniref:Alpha/beta hydrolase n=1 Tax=Paremcibacter congregatus TaxID=2043170 RepID=A0A2G4YQX5_9PROT|nr:alpha/beta hydrolase-fold protein [Paremcibacter congregatus]PHZ84734.1 hypothetical protein CRD36_10640 [Paremcibacter congregatus]QDE28928.1 alpha/beta hydrolase [Paremcibacter congregatus]